ncbi:MAG: alternative ribosome rescue aminoacyl-tRNA hydrolase ArfB, partial [Candidatus Sericytochromatia bacterium]
DWIISPQVRIPQEAVELRAVRSGGPGGQHVNKVSSKVELRVSLDAIEGLTPGARHRLTLLAGRRLTQDGVLLLTAEESRHQFANREAVERKMVELVQAALVPPKPRRATKPTKGSQERRITAKKKSGEKKRARRPIRDE